MDTIPKEQPDAWFLSGAVQGRAGWAYAIRNADTNLVKLGVSTDPRRRLRDLSTGSPAQLELLWRHEGGLSLEALLHRRFADRHIRGEWFNFADADVVAVLNHAATAFEEGLK